MATTSRKTATPARRRPKKTSGPSVEEFLAVVRAMDATTRGFFEGVFRVFTVHGPARAIQLCEGAARSFGQMSRMRRSRQAKGHVDQPVAIPAGFPLPPDSMDVLGALTFLRAILYKPNPRIDEGARIALLGLVCVALRDLEPAPLPDWFFAWQAFSDEQQSLVTKLVTGIVKERERAVRPH